MFEDFSKPCGLMEFILKIFLLLMLPYSCYFMFTTALGIINHLDFMKLAVLNSKLTISCQVCMYTCYMAMAI